jgi:hypothetical protein
MKAVNFFIREAPVHVSVVNTEAVGLSTCLGVGEGVNYCARLCKIATYASDNLKKVIFWKSIVLYPERNIFVACWVLAVRFKFCDLVGLKLADKTGVRWPKLSNVVNIKKFHRPPFQTQAESPPYFFRDVSLCILHNAIKDDAAT